jgi:hypothetical protein
MTPLALSGSALSVSGAVTSGRRTVLRLRDPASGEALHERDAALVRTVADWAAARDGGFNKAVVVGSGAGESEASGFALDVRLGDRFGHLAAGDVIGLETKSLRLRVLYRRLKAQLVSGYRALQPLLPDVLAATARR